MASSSGPFAACVTLLSPESFVNSCVNDLCTRGGNHSLLCLSMATYAEQCQARGIPVDQWRTSTSCGITCPANSHYELCGARCQDSCSASTEPTCLAPCSEGCFCNTGFLRSGNECVSAGQCGCSYEGRYYKLGDMAWMSSCTKRCTCVAPGVFNCVAASCPSPQYCAVKGGSLGCQDDTTSCVVSGGTHYLTFDRSVAHFQGTCVYEITSTCNSSFPHSFRVTAENQKDANVSSISQVAISFQTSGQQVRLVVGRDKAVQVNGTEVSLPASIQSTAQVTYDDEWQDVRVTLWNDTEIRYDGSNTLIIRVGPRYENQLCGLCGNFNGNATDDKVLPDGTLATSDQEFGNSWTSESSSAECSNQTKGPDWSSSNSSQEARDLCGVLTNTSGPFADCRWYENPDPFYVSCLYDVSLYGWSNYMRCRAIRSYEQICSIHGAAISTWWPSLNCFPGQVRNVTLLPESSTTLFINWYPPEGGAGSYVVRILGTPSLNTTVITEHLTVLDLVPGNHYTVEVSAQDGPRQGATVSISGFTVPNVTNILDVTKVTIDSVSLSWLPPTGNRSFYSIHVLGYPASNVTTFSEFVSIRNLIPGNYYTFLVSAVSGNGLQGKSSMISVYTVPKVINELNITKLTIDSVSLSWLPPTGNKTFYFIQVLGNPASNMAIVHENVTITNLIPGNYYTFLVSAGSGNGLQGNSSMISGYTVPNVTNNLNVTDVSTNSVYLSWLPPTGNKSYYVIQVLGNPAPNVKAFYENVSISNLIPGNYYTFLVSAVAGNGLQGKSSMISGYTVPNVTNNLDVTEVTINSVYLSWLPPTGNKSFYLIQVLGNPSSNMTTFYEDVPIKNLIPGNYYTFLVSALSGNGLEGKSSMISEYTEPNVTNDLNVTGISLYSVSLSWLPPTGNRSFYVIQVLGNPASNVTTFHENESITNLIPGNYYTFLVSAVSGNGLQGKSSMISVNTEKHQIVNLTVVEVSIDSISLSWGPGTNGISSYLVKMSGNPSSNVTTLAEFVNITNLIPGNYYTFIISAVFGNGDLGFEYVISEYTVPNVTNNLSITDVSIDSMSLSWQLASGNKSYYLIQVEGNPASNVSVFTEYATIPNLIPGNHYKFVVSAVSGSGLLGDSSVISQYTVPNVTNKLAITDVSFNSVSLSWLPPTGNKSYYLIQVLGNPTSNVTVFTEFVPITHLIPGNNYTFLVSAVSDNGLVGKSSVISQYTVSGLLFPSLKFTSRLPAYQRKEYIISKLNQWIQDHFPEEEFILLWNKEIKS